MIIGTFSYYGRSEFVIATGAHIVRPNRGLNINYGRLRGGRPKFF